MIAFKSMVILKSLLTALGSHFDQPEDSIDPAKRDGRLHHDNRDF